MRTVLLDLALRGALVSFVVILLDGALGRRQDPRGRRLWWLLVALAWILPFHLPRTALVSHLSMPLLFEVAPSVSDPRLSEMTTAPFDRGFDWSTLLIPLWLGGAVLSIAIIFARTAWTTRRWSRVRLSTHPALLDLLEDCKATAGVRAPFGLIVSPDVSTPALLGWLRPRILLPEKLVGSVGREELRGILLHELAHFDSADIPLQWLFCLGQSLHWFNPIVHLATRRWIHFRELAADASALAWMPAANRHAYGDALVAAIRQSRLFPVPCGALALGESFQQLKFRITMIASTQRRARLVWLAALVSLALSAVILLPRAAFAQSTASQDTDKLAADASQGHTDEGKLTADARRKLTDEVKVIGEAWLKLIDEGKYIESWESSAAIMKSALTAEKWADKLNDVRPFLGKLENRSLVSSAYQTEVPNPSGGNVHGEFVIEKYDSTFEKMKTARETVSFTKDSNGQWRPAGYYVKPR